jgi:hypothetical protein
LTRGGRGDHNRLSLNGLAVAVQHLSCQDTPTDRGGIQSSGLRCQRRNSTYPDFKMQVRSGDPPVSLTLPSGFQFDDLPSTTSISSRCLD